jgi:HD-GYP domain-containing protein (c-di-GMP phosphodiesterase class II)
MIESPAPSKVMGPPLGLLFHSDELGLGELHDALAADRIERRSASELFEQRHSEESPAVLLLDRSMLGAAARLRTLPSHIVVVAADAESAQEFGGDASLDLSAASTREESLKTLRTAYQLAAARLSAARAERELARTRGELRELQRIGMALMTERDPDRLLHEILTQAKRLTHSDAGSLYLVEKDENKQPRLRIKLSETDSLPDLPFQEFTLPISPTSLSGYAASTGLPLVLDDAYELPKDAPYSLNRSFDQQRGYRTKSMLVVPMLDHRDDVVGVLQLINRKSVQSALIISEEAADRFVLSYTEHELQLVQSLAGQAAVSIENSQLYAQIEHLFESFVKAAVTAIDQRDPTTAGHSVRVATLTTDMAMAVERFGTGEYKGVQFSRDQIRELRYAAMLHDFGKVGVREEVLIKSKKLPPFLWERVESRFDLIRRTAEAEYHKRRAAVLLGSNNAESLAAELDAEFKNEMARLDQFQFAVRTANEPSVLPEEAAGILVDISQHSYERPDGKVMPYLAPDELHFLQIPRGSLDERERVEIESHVEQTYRFLTQIPWTEDLQNLAIYAYGHHEKLNGKGYPRRISGDEIPIQTRMMTIADIFDALTASDRPYKRALPTEKALAIVQAEAKEGMLDPDLVQVLIESQVYRRVLEEDWRNF